MASNETSVPSINKEGISTMASKEMTDNDDSFVIINPDMLDQIPEEFSRNQTAIKSLEDNMTQFPEVDYKMKGKVLEIIRLTQSVLTKVLNELVVLRSFQTVAEDSLWCLEMELDFMKMDIEVFLKENELSKYKTLFDEEEIFSAPDLLNERNIKIDDLESNMKPASFNRLKEKLSDARHNKHFVKYKMENELDQAGAKCEQRTSKLTEELTEASCNVAKVAKEVMKAIADRKKTVKVNKCLFQVTNLGANLLIAHSQIGMFSQVKKESFDVVDAMISKQTLTPYGATGTVFKLAQGFSEVFGSKSSLLNIACFGVKCFAEEIFEDAAASTYLASMEAIESKMLICNKYIGQTITYFEMLSKKCTCLADMLKSNGRAFDKKATGSLRSRIEKTKKAVNEFDEDIDDLRNNVSRYIRMLMSG